MSKIDEYLKGCRVIEENGHPVIQRIAGLSLAFLTCEPEFSQDELFANPLKELQYGNNGLGYGHLNIFNPTDKIAVVPQVAVIARGAQNHAMTKSVMIRKEARQTFDDAACVEGAQPGHIMAGNVNSVRMLPIAIREAALDRSDFYRSGHSDFRRLYGILNELGRLTNSHCGEYLDKFFSHFGTTFETFVAHFEQPTRTIGVIVMLNGEIVALDKFPSFRYTSWVWDVLIRDAYGVLALPTFSGDVKPVDFKDSPPNEVASYPALAKVYIDKELERERANLLYQLDALEDEEFSEVLDRESMSNFIDSANFKGQLMLTDSPNGRFYHYISIIRKDAFDEAKRKAREIQQKYGELASKQSAFNK